MLLTLDVGNSQIFAGVYDGEDLRITFRRTSSIRASSDEFGTFFRVTLRENGIEPEEIEMAAICSVAPDAVHSLRNCFRKYFRFEPFLLQPGVKTGLKIRYRNPLEVGADKIANAIGALTRFPGRNLLIVDFGTATTLCAVTKEKEHLAREQPVIVATGGFGRLFEAEHLFDVFVPELSLIGLRRAVELSRLEA